MVLYEEGVFFIRASIDHFSQGCLAKKINPHSSIHVETVTWPKRPGRKEIEFVNATTRALMFLVLPTSWSQKAIQSVEMGVEVEGFSVNLAISRVVSQGILEEATDPQLFQIPALELNEPLKAGQMCLPLLHLPPGKQNGFRCKSGLNNRRGSNRVDVELQHCKPQDTCCDTPRAVFRGDDSFTGEAQIRRPHHECCFNSHVEKRKVEVGVNHIDGCITDDSHTRRRRTKAGRSIISA